MWWRHAQPWSVDGGGGGVEAGWSDSLVFASFARLRAISGGKVEKSVRVGCFGRWRR
jgi:hypothetical protein